MLYIGTVENVKVAPAFDVDGVMDDEDDDEIVQVETWPCVGPEAASTVMVHEIGLPVRCGAPATHASVDAVVGAAFEQVGPDQPELHEHCKKDEIYY